MALILPNRAAPTPIQFAAAQLMQHTSEAVLASAGLRAVATRDRAAFAEVALTVALDHLLDAAGPNVRPMHCIAALAVQRGRAGGMALSEVVAAMQAAFMDMALAALEDEEAAL